MTKQTDRNRIAGLILSVAILALTPAAGRAQTAGQEIKALWTEVLQLKQANEAMQKEIASMKRPPAANLPAAFDNADVRLAGDAGFGSSDAKVTLVEFADYQCPFCRKAAQETLPRLLKEYVDTGKVRYVVHEFPLESIHSHALDAAVAARCAGEQGKYREMHEQLFANNQALEAENLRNYARQIGLNDGVFQACVHGPAQAAKVRADIEAGEKLGITGTPAFLLGVTDAGNPDLLKATRKLSGAQPYTVFQAAIESLLEAAEPSAAVEEHSRQ